MAHLQYNGVDLQIERTAEVSIEPVQDPTSGLDLLYQRIRISMICVWQPYATASNSVNGIGDRAGVSLVNLRQKLMTPQQLLIYSIGPDRVFQVPRTFTLGGGPSTQGACDPAGGPFPKSCRILSVHGDKTVIISYSIEFHDTDCAKFVLSNRWSLTSQTGEQYLSTRITEGRAVLRLDLLNLQGAVADAFRGAFSLYVPAGFSRTDVNVVATEDGREVIYRVVDRQTNINLDGQWGVVKVEGNATCGSDFPYPTLTGLATAMGHAIADTSVLNIAEGALALLPDWVGKAARLGGALAGQAAGLIPKQKGNAVVRVFGGANVSYKNLATIAVNIAADCFAPAWLAGIAFPVSSYVTQVFDTHGPGPIAQARLELALLNPNALAAMTNAGLLPLSFSYQLGGNAGSGVPDVYAAPGKLSRPFPNGGSLVAPASNASRGTWVAFLVTQALTQGCQINAIPATDNALPAQPGIAQPQAAGVASGGFALS